MPPMGTCVACDDTKVRQLPRFDALEEYPCPICQPWPNGFPGEVYGKKVIIEPSQPNQPAVYNGWN